MEYRQDIQILRGISVIFVVLFHLQIPFFQNGFLGVDIFFVISGFLMAKLYDKGTVLDFYRRRIDRLLPAYAFTIIATLAISSFLLVPVDFLQLFKQSIAGFFFSDNIYFWSQNSYFSKTAFNPLLNLWSLGVEAQFYLFVPLLFPFLQRWKWLTALTIIGSLALCVLIQTVSPKTSFFMMPLRVWEFMIGAWVAWNLAKTRLHGIPLEALKTCLLLILLFLIFSSSIDPEGKSIFLGHPSVFAFLLCMISAAIIYYGMPKFIEKSFFGAMLTRLGDYSYSLYLVHFPIIVLWNYEIFGGTKLGFQTATDFIAIISLLMIFTCIFYTYVEKKKYAALSSGKGRVAILCSILLFGFGMQYMNKAKYSEQEKNIFAAWTDRSEYRCGKVFRIIQPGSKICRVTKTNNDKRVLLLGSGFIKSTI